MDVWVVTYRKKAEDEPVVTTFDNYNAAKKMYDTYKPTIGVSLMSLDKCPLYSNFIKKKTAKILFMITKRMEGKKNVWTLA